MSDCYPDRATFAALFENLSPRVYAYARRRCEVDDAQDVVSEVFLVAWRRWSDMPSDSDRVLPWLLVVARHTIANRRRGDGRRDRLTLRVADTDRLRTVAGADENALERATVVTALAELTDLEREAVLLVAWDGLSNTDAAVVAGCSRRAFEVRLSRARARLTRALRDAAPDPPHRFPARPAPDPGTDYAIGKAQ